jgi:hypothetical protein
MTITTIAGNSGAEGMRLVRMLASHATDSETHLLHAERHAIAYVPPAHVTVTPILAEGAAYEAELVKRVTRLKGRGSIFIDLPHGHVWSVDLLALTDVAMVAVAPSQVSIVECLHLLRKIEAAQRVQPNGLPAAMIGWDAAGGPAAGSRLFAAAERAIRRDPGLALDGELLLPFWPLPPLHWTETDYALGLADRPANSRIDDEILGALRTIWSLLRDRAPEEAFRKLARPARSGGIAGAPHSEGTRLALLCHDLHLIDAGLAPTPEDLRHAPQLSPWRIEPIIATALRGSVANHPILDTRKDIVTSLLMAIDPHQMWARTASRFYGLGRPEWGSSYHGLVSIFAPQDTPDDGQPH